MPASRSVNGTVDEAAARRPTLTQVAALAGVSLKTASRALNNEPNVPVSCAGAPRPRWWR
jgi:LacI family transcriptional regulator